ncbi:MAG TPA: 4Fe-4S dicluster domain-containing protein, partial [Candidatus Avimonas sp.]|nr:4Fe-4S dicluster domain-containing protein [Candidatus Avimonas sp.]
MVSEMDRIKCTGCGACAAGCPVRCIELKPDGEGFVYPVIDRERCTRCGICDEICHARCLVKGGAGRPATFIAYNKDQKDRISSSSGGIFISLARQVILEGGVVYGAALDEDMRVRHIRVETEDCLSELQGSKYV